MTSMPAPDRLLADAAWLRNLARHLVGDGLAADLQQDVAVAVLAQPQAAAGGRSWLAAVARNLAVSFRRRATAERRRVAALSPREPVVSPAELVATAELQQRAVAALLQLPPVYRDTLLMRFLRGLSPAATAAAMGVPEETVRTRQKRALAQLREQLMPAREKRGAVTLLTSLVGWGVVVKAKHVVVGAAALLVALLVTVPTWPGQGAASPAAPPPGLQPAASEASRAAHRGATVATGAEEAAESVQRTAVGERDAAATLSVRVIWEDDRAPAAGVPVFCHRTADAGVCRHSDVLGDVRFAELPAGEFFLRTLIGDGASATLAAGEQRVLELVVARGKAASGIVLDPDDRPVAGAEILASWAGREPQRLFPCGVSDVLGHFAIEGLPLYAVVGARHEQLGTSDFRHLLGDPSQGSPTVTLWLPGAARSVRGRVVDPDGRPVAGAWIQVGNGRDRLRRDATGDPLDVYQAPPGAQCTSNAEGRFEASGLQPRELRLLVYRRGFAPQREVLQLETANAPDLLIALRPGAALAGTLRDGDGRLLAGASVCRRSSDYPERSSCETDTEGRFRFEDLAAGQLEFEATASGFAHQRRTFVFAAAETQHWDVVMRAGSTIRGRLVDNLGQPLAGWSVSRTSGGQSVTSTTSADGTFEIDDPDPDGATLVLRTSVFGPEVCRFEGVLGRDQEQSFVVAAEHQPTAWLRGRVADDVGAPLAGAEVGLLQDDWPVLDSSVRSAADGSFAVGPLPPGRYVVAPSHPGLVFHTATVDLAPREQKRLEEMRGVAPAHLVVRLSAPGAVLAIARAELVAGNVRLRGREEGAERTFLHVLPGRYRLVVSVDGKEVQGIDVELAAGSTLRRELELR